MATVVKFTPGTGNFKSRKFQLTPIDQAGNPSTVEQNSYRVEEIQKGVCTATIDPATGIVEFNRGTLDVDSNINESIFDVVADPDLTSDVKEIRERFSVILSVAEAVGFGVADLGGVIDEEVVVAP